MKSIFIHGVLFYAVLVLVFYTLSERLIFQPPKPSPYPTENVIKLPVGDKQISAIFLPSRQSEFTILYSHGNAEDLSSLYPFLEAFQAQGYSIISYDYQGYGQSQGSPSENNTYQDIEAVYQYLVNKKQIDPQKIIVYGRSVGTGPSVYLASRFPVEALILESPMVSAYRVMTHAPIIPFDRYPNLRLMKKINLPLLVIHGKNDNVIPLWHGKAILDTAKGNKHALFVENAGHNDIMMVDSDKYWKAIHEFTQQLNE